MFVSFMVQGQQQVTEGEEDALLQKVILVMEVAHHSKSLECFKKTTISLEQV